MDGFLAMAAWFFGAAMLARIFPPKRIAAVHQIVDGFPVALSYFPDLEITVGTPSLPLRFRVHSFIFLQVRGAPAELLDLLRPRARLGSRWHA